MKALDKLKIVTLSFLWFAWIPNSSSAQILSNFKNENSITISTSEPNKPTDELTEFIHKKYPNIKIYHKLKKIWNKYIYTMEWFGENNLHEAITNNFREMLKKILINKNVKNINIYMSVWIWNLQDVLFSDWNYTMIYKCEFEEWWNDKMIDILSAWTMSYNNSIKNIENWFKDSWQKNKELGEKLSKYWSNKIKYIYNYDQQKLWNKQIDLAESFAIVYE